MKKYLVLSHDILGEIPRDEILEALNETESSCHIEIISFREELNLTHGETINLSWKSLKAEQAQFFEKNVQSRLEDLKDQELVYFGLAPIPLAIHLGYLVTSLIGVDVFLKRHDSKDWIWKGAETHEPVIENLPGEAYNVEGDITLRFGTSYLVNSDLASEIVVDPLRDVSMHAPVTGIDIFSSYEAVESYATKFRFVIDELINNLPKANSIHLFASIPVGLAFLIGQKITPTIHHKIRLYDYSKDSSPAYREAFTVQDEAISELVIPDEKISALEDLKRSLEQELERVKGFVDNLPTEQESWFANLFSGLDSSLFSTILWQPLTHISETDLKSSSFSKTAHDENETKFYVNGKWHLSYEFLYVLMNKYNSEMLMSSIRMFWFHEVLHVRSHGINSENSEGLGRYPRILEEADYQADVYAILHEYKYRQTQKINAHDFFVQAIEIVIQTMWVFDETQPNYEIQVRRMNRYLIWYFQLCLIEMEKISLPEILEILASKPLLELKLHGITTPDRKRILFNLKSYRKEELGIAVFFNNKLNTRGHDGGQLSLDRLIDGFKDRDGDAIKEVFRQLLVQII